MTDPEQPQAGVIEFKCPYCGALLLRDYDISEIDEEILDDLPNPIWAFDCPHVATYGVWGYLDVETSPFWLAELELICKCIDPESELSVGDLLPALAEEETNYRDILAENLPTLEIAFLDQYIEKGAGVQGGGPTFQVLLINKKV
jgi:hypothetical protein